MAWNPEFLYTPTAFDLPGPRAAVQPVQYGPRADVLAAWQQVERSKIPPLLLLAGLGLLAWKVLE